ncbi:biotin transporter BioY [Jiella sonneratiae]|uniref:Biotin transporter n=1 Tax=Jiella sonneratiae TaxID=2816856 RepID=A0ABS3J1N0_9HYPH|nr:biotin transporter BioY [Jiella sonneratiae]MBO0903567.1 biotin transporter BioY [Jiella sonneratiae]
MSTRDIVLIALFAALMAALGAFPPLMIPAIAVPVTAQSMGPMLAGGILGAKRGALSMLLFVVLVAAGLPLLSGGRGGLAIFAGPTAGFIFGWIVAAFATGLVVERFWAKLTFVTAFLAAAAGGIVLLYAIGIPWISLVGGVPLATAATGSAAFIPGDLIKAGLAAAAIVMVRRAYPMIRQEDRWRTAPSDDLD